MTMDFDAAVRELVDRNVMEGDSYSLNETEFEYTLSFQTPYFKVYTGPNSREFQAFREFDSASFDYKRIDEDEEVVIVKLVKNKNHTIQ